MAHQEANGLEAVAEIVIAAAASVAAGGAPKDAAAAVVPVAVSRLIPAIGQVFVSAQRRRVERWLTEIATAMSLGSAEEVDALIGALEDDGRKRGLLESYRHLLNMLDDSVTPLLAKLTALYVAPGRGPDAFFRSVGGLLAELERDDCDCLTQLFLQIELHSDESWTGVQLHLFKRDRQDLVEISAWRSGAQEPEKTEVSMWATRERLLHVLALLKRFDLARDTAAGTWDSMAGPDVARFDPRVVRRLLPLFTTSLPPGGEYSNTPREG